MKINNQYCIRAAYLYASIKPKPREYGFLVYDVYSFIFLSIFLRNSHAFVASHCRRPYVRRPFQRRSIPYFFDSSYAYLCTFFFFGNLILGRLRPLLSRTRTIARRADRITRRGDVSRHINYLHFEKRSKSSRSPR